MSNREMAQAVETSIGVQEEEDFTSAIVVIEFKRPVRDDYQADPAQQIIKRFVEIQESKHRRCGR